MFRSLAVSHIMRCINLRYLLPSLLADFCGLCTYQIVGGGGGNQMPLHAGGVPSYFQYPALAGCLQPGTQPHVIQHGGRTVPHLCNGGVKYVLPAATIPIAPPPPLCVTSLVLTPVNGFQGTHQFLTQVSFCCVFLTFSFTFLLFLCTLCTIS